MRRVILSFLVLACSTILVDRADCAGPVSATLNAVGGSGVGGSVVLKSVSAGMTRVSVRVTGLQFEVEYIAAYSSTVACDVGTAPTSGAFARFRGGKRGTARVTAEVAAPIDQIHSIAIQLGNGLTLLACAPVN